MESFLQIHDTLTRSKKRFEPLNPPFAGMYVCGPTVYGDPHLGHARAAITFDLVYRWLLQLGYKVRYVRNITDVGHLEADLDEGEDKIAKKARVEQLEPMEVAQYYADRYFLFMDALNVRRPSIEPRASGHMIEQISLVQKIIDAGYAYLVNGSVYFDVEKYGRSNPYGQLSGRILDDLLSNTRELEGQDEKRNPADFALWKKAQPEHIMRWPSPWSDGFPGWHVECSAMSNKYLGETFDIHGGGMDLLFPHHEAEIAQCRAAHGHESVRYWMHNNMVTINGQKMGKSLGNFITLDEFFTGNHPALTQAYSPMTIRFFMMQAHYRSTLDFSNEALQAAEKGLKRLLSGYETVVELIRFNQENKVQGSLFMHDIRYNCEKAMNNDFNSPVVISELFGAVQFVNQNADSAQKINLPTLECIKEAFEVYLFGVLGIKNEKTGDNREVLDGLMELILSIRQRSRENKDWGTSDQIRDALQNLHITVKDGKEGSKWEMG
ncbi:MAG TPA: cysteine--tRNA ligase [Bacteroidales bacterium]|nr:cysteine--tRNA ligase [Bacteroidales bacterium]HPS62451.1 cysteine--tRNA ligase [Bacteroidales bacterium]